MWNSVTVVHSASYTMGSSTVHIIHLPADVGCIYMAHWSVCKIPTLLTLDCFWRVNDSLIKVSWGHSQADKAWLLFSSAVTENILQLVGISSLNITRDSRFSMYPIAVSPNSFIQPTSLNFALNPLSLTSSLSCSWMPLFDEKVEF